MITKIENLAAQLYIGTSGWSYSHWKRCFYRDIAQKNWLSFYAEHFSTVEINGSFYRLQNPTTLQKWYDETPANFRFTLKANRYSTHRKKLLSPLDSIAIEKSHAAALQDKLAVVLWQLPKTWAINQPRLTEFLRALRNWPEVRHTIEFRHPSWFTDETAEKMTEAGAIICLSDAGDWPLWERITTDAVYIRLHGKPQTYASCYSSRELEHWARHIRQWLRQNKHVYVYFDNDAECAAPENARTLRTLLLPLPGQ